ncbi:MAG: hypothetical protein K8S54_03445 [Spirochaetia bacterium]|nr:hypothetical protein [Spirochaetia bacterium]
MKSILFSVLLLAATACQTLVPPNNKTIPHPGNLFGEGNDLASSRLDNILNMYLRNSGCLAFGQRGLLFNNYTVPLYVGEIPHGDISIQYDTYCLLNACASTGGFWKELRSHDLIAVHTVDADSLTVAGFSSVKFRINGWSRTAYRLQFGPSESAKQDAAFVERVILVNGTEYRRVRTRIDGDTVTLERSNGDPIIIRREDILSIERADK